MTRIDDVLAGDKSWGKYSLDVLGHVGLGTAYALPFVALATYFNLSNWIALSIGAAVALFGGALREVVQYRKSGKLHLLDRVLDAAQHPLGAPVALGLVAIAKVIWW